MDNIITVDDIKLIRQITSNIDDVASIDPYIQEAQNVNFKNLLGIRFYNVFRKGYTTDPIPERWTKFVDGTTYNLPAPLNTEIEYPGIKPLLAYYAYARAIPHLGKRVARFGVVKKNTSFSEHAEPGEISDMVLAAKSNAKTFEADLMFFLENNRLVYPEFFEEWNAGIKSSIRISASRRGKKSYE